MSLFTAITPSLATERKSEFIGFKTGGEKKKKTGVRKVSLSISEISARLLKYIFKINITVTFDSDSEDVSVSVVLKVVLRSTSSGNLVAVQILWAPTQILEWD